MKTNVDPGTTVTRDKLMGDLNAVVEDAEALLRVTGSEVGEKIGEQASAARVRLQETIEAAKTRLANAQEVLVERTKQAARVTDEYVHEYPWKSIGIGVSVGIIIGMLIARR